MCGVGHGREGDAAQAEEIKGQSPQGRHRLKPLEDGHGAGAGGGEREARGWRSAGRRGLALVHDVRTVSPENNGSHWRALFDFSQGSGVRMRRVQESGVGLQILRPHLGKRLLVLA